MTTGQKISFLRKKKNITQEALALSMGVSRQSVSAWEGDAVLPNTEQVVRLSKTFGVSTDYLLTEKELDEGDKKGRKAIGAYCGVSYGLMGLIILSCFISFVVSEATYRAWIGLVIYVSIALCCLIAFLIYTSVFKYGSDFSEDDEKAIEKAKIGMLFSLAIASGVSLPLPITDFFSKEEMLSKGGIVIEPSIVNFQSLWPNEILGVAVSLIACFIGFVAIRRSALKGLSSLWYLNLAMALVYAISTILFSFAGQGSYPFWAGLLWLGLPILVLFLGKRIDWKVFLALFPSGLLGGYFVQYESFDSSANPWRFIVGLVLSALFAGVLVFMMIRNLKKGNNALIYPAVGDVLFVVGAATTPFAKIGNGGIVTWPFLVAGLGLVLSGIVSSMTLCLASIYKNKKKS